MDHGENGANLERAVLVVVQAFSIALGHVTTLKQPMGENNVSEMQLIHPLVLLQTVQVTSIFTFRFLYIRIGYCFGLLLLLLYFILSWINIDLTCLFQKDIYILSFDWSCTQRKTCWLAFKE